MRIKAIISLLVMSSFCYTSDFQIYLDLGKQLKEEKKYEQALQQFEKALQDLPSDHETRLILANTFLQLGYACFHELHSELAIRAFKNILCISQNIQAAHHNIGFTLAERLGKYQEAIPFYKQALNLKPDCEETHFCLALAYLATNNLIRGFQEYEWRWKRSVDRKPRRNFNYPLERQWQWQDLNGKRIVLRVEQGLGDTLHFIRYAQILKEMGATVIAETQKPLMQLLSLCDYIDEVILVDQQLPTFDYQIPLISLAHIFRTSVHTIPLNIPYLQADAHLIELWKQKIKQDQNIKVGICWCGDPVHGSLKFMPLSHFEKLTQLPGFSFYSLQKSKKTISQIQSIISFDDFDETHGSFMDTAALMKNLDLVITVDTSVVHLAGGLGVPVWLVLPFPAEWRWLMEHDDSPWYPTMRLFRQKEVGRWDEVLNALRKSLITLIN